MSDEKPSAASPSGDDLVRREARSSLKLVVRALQAGAVVALVVYALSGIRMIQPSEVGVQLAFGRAVRADLAPGIHYALPWPAGRIERVPVKTVERLVVDDLSSSLATDSASGAFYKRTGLKSYCLTGDNNLVHVTFTLQYLVADPVDYLYRSQDHEQLLRHLASSAVSHAIARTEVKDVQTTAKGDIEEEVRHRLAADLDALDAGIGIASVELTNVSPPAKVQKYFDDVVNAQMDASKMVSEAEAYRNSKLPEAKGKASRLVQQARAYRQQQVSHAEGEADRFLAQLTEYHKARQVSRQRLYLDFVARVYPTLYNKIVVDSVDGEPVGDIRLQGAGKR